MFPGCCSEGEGWGGGGSYWKQNIVNLAYIQCRGLKLDCILRGGFGLYGVNGEFEFQVSVHGCKDCQLWTGVFHHLAPIFHTASYL